MRVVNISNNDNIVFTNVAINDINGRTVKTMKVNNLSEVQLDVNELSSGVYFMNITTDSGIAVKKFIASSSRYLVFEQNTIATRNKFLAIVNPYLESVVQRQGLYAYRVVMDDSNNTADIVDRNQIVGQIFIQPAKTAEFVVLDFTIEPTGATFVA